MAALSKKISLPPLIGFLEAMATRRQSILSWSSVPIKQILKGTRELFLTLLNSIHYFATTYTNLFSHICMGNLEEYSKEGKRMHILNSSMGH